MSFFSQSQEGNLQMNNADSFSMAFDNIWKQDIAKIKNAKIDQKEKINIAFSKIEDHPFLKNNPSKAREIALFRIRLLNLN